MIDTWNRDHKGPNFVPGPLPKAAVSPPDAIYSGLLECPCTDRITKIIDGAYVLQQNGTCSTEIKDASQCFKVVETQLGLSGVKTQTISDPAAPPGCAVSLQDNSTVATFNQAASTKPCGGVIQKTFGSQTGDVNLTLALDHAATITLSGPADAWFGIGFDATRMADKPYTIVVDGAGKV